MLIVRYMRENTKVASTRCSGIFYVAEVTSRLVDKPGFIELISSFGFEIVNHVSAHADSSCRARLWRI